MTNLRFGSIPRDDGVSSFSNVSSSAAQLICDINMAQRFLTLLDEEESYFTFQTFDDDATGPGERRQNLAQVRHGKLEGCFSWLCHMNNSGAGIFVTINRTDGLGRKKANMTGIRAVWQEDDGAGLALPIEPHIEVESSPGKYHRYLLADGGDDWQGFDQVMLSMVREYGSDPNAKDRSRVMRLPGFYHLKDPKRPHLVRVVHESGALPLAWNKVLDCFKAPSTIFDNARSHYHGLDVDEAKRAIATGENYHGSLRDLAAHYVATGIASEQAIMLLEKSMATVPVELRNDRWRNRRDEIPGLVRSAVDKGFGEERAWADPIAFSTSDSPEPYPIDALPESMRKAVEQVVSHVQAPVAMAASSAIASLSLAAQAHVNVSRDSTLIGPSSLYLMVIADSGERKSTCDRHFLAPIKEHEVAERILRKDEIKKFNSDMAGWDSKLQGIKQRISALKKKGQATEEAEKELELLMNKRPQEPLIPRYIYSDVTPEALASGLANNWPSAGVMSSEGGMVFGSHGMSSDSVMRMLSMQNELWDGGTITYDRRTVESVRIENARLSMFIQVQSATLSDFLSRSGDLFRGIGSFARFLFSYPESTQGTREYREPPVEWREVESFQGRINVILSRELSSDNTGQIFPRTVKLEGAAKKAWTDFHNEVERELSDAGKYRDLRDVASKAADNCARLAALFQYFEDHRADRISTGYVMDAARIIRWHLSESLRFMGGFDQRSSPTKLLDDWLIERCIENRSTDIAISDVMQYGPLSLRKKKMLYEAIEELELMSRIRIRSNGKKKVIEINPELLAATANVAKGRMH